MLALLSTSVCDGEHLDQTVLSLRTDRQLFKLLPHLFMLRLSFDAEHS